MKKKGFTLVELIAVLAIIMISIAIASPFFINYWKNAEFQKNDSNARTIYLAAESKLTYYRNSGQWDEFKDLVQKQGIEAQGLGDDLDGRIYAITLNKEGNTNSNDLVKQLLDDSTLEASIYKKCIAIEIDIQSGEVYSAFYASKCQGLTYDQTDQNHQLTMCLRDKENRKKRLMGYYSAEDLVNVVSLKPTRLRVTTINLLNSETLSLNWSSNVKGALDVSYEIDFYHASDKTKSFSLVLSPYDVTSEGWSSGKLAKVTLKDSNGEEKDVYAFPLTYSNNKYSLILDAMMSAKVQETLQASNQIDLTKEFSTNINRLSQVDDTLEKAQDIYATVKVVSYAGNQTMSAINEYRASEAVASNEANTMFGDKSSGNSKTISTFRHLSNIRYDQDDQVTYTLTNKNMDWSSVDTGVYDFEYNARALTQELVWNENTKTNQVAFPTIANFNETDTLVGKRSDTVISNLYLDENSIVSDSFVDSTNLNSFSQYLGLFGEFKGTLKDVQIQNPTLVMNNSEDYKNLLGMGILAGNLSGQVEGLDITTTTSFTNSILDVENINSNLLGVGGIAGVITPSSKLTDVTVKGEMQATTANAGLGGLVGYSNDLASTVFSNCVNHANIQGNHDVGGLIGKAIGQNTNTNFIEDSSNDGLILSLENQGNYFGGIVGYGKKIKVYNSSSAPGANQKFSYDVSKKDLLKGNYVGGIIGYGDEVLLQNCSTSRNGYVLGNSHVGGIAGGLSKAENAIQADQNIKVTYNRSYVIGNEYVGGIVGSNQMGTIQDCVNNGAVAGYNQFIGGIVGYNDGTIQNCTSTVSDNNRAIFNQIVNQWEAKASCVGGLAGYNNGSLVFDNNNSNITVKSVASIVVGQDYVGGIIGFNDQKGKIDVNYDLIGGQVYGYGDAVGGAIGFNASTSSLTSKLTVQPRSITGHYYVGGVIGANMVNLNTNTTINSYKANNTLALVHGEAFVGGIIGYQRTYNESTDSTYNLIKDHKYEWLPNLDDQALVQEVKSSLNEYTLTIQGTTNEATNNLAMEANDYMGGIVGYDQKESKLVIKNCTNEGNLTVATSNNGVNLENYIESNEINKQVDLEETISSNLAGGIIGVNLENTIIDGCNNTGTLSGFTGTGGIVGLNAGLVINCTLSDHLGNASLNYLGGIAGINIGHSETKNYGTTSYKPGTIKACSTQANKTITGNNNIGGIVGYNMEDGVLDASTSYCNIQATGNNIGGLIGKNSGTITLTNDQTNTTKTISSSKGSSVGGIIGYNTSLGHIQVLSGTNDVIAVNNQVTITGNQQIGGIVGSNDGNIGTPTQSNYLVSQAKLIQSSNGEAGGIVGHTSGSIYKVKNSSIQVVSNTGNTGGITANNTYLIDQCINQGNVRSNNGYAGGISAVNTGTISNSQVTGNIEIYQIGENEVGSVVAINNDKGTVTSCSTDSTVSIGGNASIIGGVVGSNYGTTSKCTTPMPTIKINRNNLTVGGIVGYNEANVLDSTSTAQFIVNNYRYLGGIVGQNHKGIISTSHFNGSINESSGSKAGNCYGGIVGLNESTIENCKVEQITIDVQGVYTATSTSTSAQKESLASHVGGIAGKNEENALINNCQLVDNSNSTLTVKYGMLGGIAGFNKGSITYSGSDKTVSIMDNTITLDDLADKSSKAGLSEEKNYVRWQDGTKVDQLAYNAGSNVTTGRLKMYVTINGNLGGITSFNATTGEVSHCVSGNWFLLNSSQAIGVGTGGIIGMNESEKDLSYLVNAAFVGRSIVNDDTNRFAGGIIGNQNNSTSSDWKIAYCINYGTIYCYHSHYSGGIMGQWTGSGGAIEKCRNYGTLQTTFGTDWVGASSGIVAQLYHAYENNEYNIISCSNYGNIYTKNGKNAGNKAGANDSAGILGNVTTYRVNKQADGQKFKIQIIDCANEPGVEIYSSSMASGIFGFLSCDDPGNGDPVKTSTQNVEIRIERCRNYAQKIMGNNYATSIFGDRYGKNGWENTIVKDNFGVHLSTSYYNGSSGSNSFPIFSKGNGNKESDSNYIPKENRVNNYYIEGADSWGCTNVRIGEGSNSLGQGSGLAENGYREDGLYTLRWDQYTQSNHKVSGRYCMNTFFMYDITKQRYFAAYINYSIDWNDENLKKYEGGNYRKTSDTYNGDKLTPQVDGKTEYIDEDGYIKNAKGVITGKVLYYIDDTSISGYSTDFILNEVVSKMDNTTFTSARNTWRNVEGIIINNERTKVLQPIEAAEATIANGHISMDITPSKLLGKFDGTLCDPFAYDIEVSGNGKIYTRRIYSENDSFDIPDDLQNSKLSIKVRTVSQYDDVESSNWYTLTDQELGYILPDPEVRVELIKPSYNSSYQFQFSLNNIDDYMKTDDQGNARFENWQVNVNISNFGSVTINSKNLTPTINGKNNTSRYLTQMVSQAIINGINQNNVKSSATVTTPISITDTKPEIGINQTGSVKIEQSGTSLEDLEINVTLSTSTTSNTPPIYRVDLIGTLDDEIVTFASQDVLMVSGGSASTTFVHLPEVIKDAKDINVRVWYASSGLGPFYTYHEITDKQAISNKKYSTKVYDGLDNEGNIQWKYIKSTTLDRMYDSKSDAARDFVGCQYKPSGSLFTWLPAPVINEALEENGNNYIFKWDQSLPSTSTYNYSVALTGIDNNGNEVLINTDYDGHSRELSVDASNWNYTQVRLKVTRLGSGTHIGLSSEQEFKVKQRLTAPGQPTVKNMDDNELNYQIQWSSLTDETNCKGYQAYIRTYENDVLQDPIKLGSVVDVDTTNGGLYTQTVNLEAYAGKKVVIYLIALASDNSDYIDSIPGITYELTIPSRLDAPNVNWDPRWIYSKDQPMAADVFKQNGLSIYIQADPSSIPPGGSAYLLKAYVYNTKAEADSSSLSQLGNYITTYAIDAPVQMDQVSSQTYHHEIEGLSINYAGKWVVFYTRISSGGGNVSSAWTQSSGIQLPYVKLAKPSITSDTVSEDVQVNVVTNPDVPGVDKIWKIEHQKIEFDQVELAEGYQFDLSGSVVDQENTSYTTPISSSLRILKDNDSHKVQEYVKQINQTTKQEEWVWVDLSANKKKNDQQEDVEIFTSNNYKVDIASSYQASTGIFSYQLSLNARIEITKKSDGTYYYELVLPDARTLKDETGIVVTPANLSVTSNVKVKTLAKENSNYVESDQEDVKWK